MAVFIQAIKIFFIAYKVMGRYHVCLDIKARKPSKLGLCLAIAESDEGYI